MRHRSVAFAAASLVAVSVLLPGVAAAGPATENLSRSTYDASPELTDASWRIDGATAGPLGGYLDLTATASDGSLPTAPGVCEPVRVSAVLTVSPGEVLTVDTGRGQACVHAFGGTLSIIAPFRDRDVTYQGTEHRRVRVVGDGLLSAGLLFTGAQAKFDATLRW